MSKLTSPATASRSGLRPSSKMDCFNCLSQLKIHLNSAVTTLVQLAIARCNCRLILQQSSTKSRQKDISRLVTSQTTQTSCGLRNLAKLMWSYAGAARGKLLMTILHAKPSHHITTTSSLSRRSPSNCLNYLIKFLVNYI